MTEQEWLACAEPALMLTAIAASGTERKLRLFNTLCCRAVWDRLCDQRSREAVRVAEEFADGLATEEMLSSTAVQALAAYMELDRAVYERRDESELEPRLRVATAAYLAAMCGGRAVVGNTPITVSFAVQHVESVSSVRTGCPWDAEATSDLLCILRDLFGNPFRPVNTDPVWLTSTVVALASGIYADRAFDRLPILADALQDAGCENTDILDHCRSEGPHVRGCWVVDLLLGKS